VERLANEPTFSGDGESGGGSGTVSQQSNRGSHLLVQKQALPHVFFRTKKRFALEKSEKEGRVI